MSKSEYLQYVSKLRAKNLSSLNLSVCLSLSLPTHLFRLASCALVQRFLSLLFVIFPVVIGCVPSSAAEIYKNLLEFPRKTDVPYIIQNNETLFMD